jgi:SCY1-like protein 1
VLYVRSYRACTVSVFWNENLVFILFQTMGTLLPDSHSITSPEVKKSGYSALKEYASDVSAARTYLTNHDRYNVAAADGYALGLLIHAVFNPSHPLPATAQPPHSPPNASSRGSIPLIIFPSFKRLLNPNPKSRLTPKQFLELGMAETAGEGSGFFANNGLVKICAGLDNFNIASESDKASLLRYEMVSRRLL